MQWKRDDGAREWEDDEPRPGGAQAAAGPRGSSAATASAAEAIAALTHKHALPPEIATEIRNAADVATARHREHLVDRAEAAYGAYERGRFQDAMRAIKPVADEAPGVAAVRELAGLAAYRCGRWRSAAGHLEAFGRLSDSAEHLPVLMDCQRALHKPKKVAALWAELRQSSPDPDVLAEGRIVAAASLADSGDLNGAIAMLANAGASKALRNPSERHVRQWYLLADLYERAGDVPKAGSTSSGCSAPTPRPTTWRSACAGSAPSADPGPRRTKAKTATSTKTGPAATTKGEEAVGRTCDSRTPQGAGVAVVYRPGGWSSRRGRRCRRGRRRGGRGGGGRWRRRPEVRPLHGHQRPDGGEGQTSAASA